MAASASLQSPRAASAQELHGGHDHHDEEVKPDFSRNEYLIEGKALRKFLSDFELVLSQKSHVDRLIANARCELDELNTRLAGSEKEGKGEEARAIQVNKVWKEEQLHALEYNRDWLLRQRGVMCSAFNALLNTMHFDVSEISLDEMRYRSAASKVRIERMVSDLDND